MDERKAMDVAATQHSLITHSQALELGLTRHQVRHRLDEGVLVAVHEGVYRYSSAPESREQRFLAACLAVGPISAASHRAAAAMHGIWLVPSELVEVSVDRTRSPEHAGVRIHRLADLNARWIVQVDGVPVTTPG